ncbi:MAG: Lrp/AsnC family transcriptional regulator [Armatimonadetes bacterium]|nr:MAG: Lrp/AsnC family transcriptional regulator [Armatimonadota bacterium]
MKLDDTDKAIIGHLQSDGRMPFSNLGPLVGLSPAAVRQRVLHLIDEGAMQIVAVTDPTTLGFTVQAMAGLTLEGDLDATAKKIAEIDAVDYVVVVAGRFDVMIEVVAEDMEGLMAIMNRIRAIPGVVGSEVFTYMSLEKQTYNWGTR